jgi:hypothetical protein
MSPLILGERCGSTILPSQHHCCMHDAVCTCMFTGLFVHDTAAISA